MRRLTVRKYVFYRDVEFAHVVLAEAVFIPAHCFEEQTSWTQDWEIEGDHPLRIERLWERRGGLLRVAQSYHEKLTLSVSMLRLASKDFNGPDRLYHFYPSLPSSAPVSDISGEDSYSQVSRRTYPQHGRLQYE